MNTSPELTISKLDASKRQLETALRIYFGNGDPVSIHTLVGAAYNVLRDLSKVRGAEPILLEDSLNEWIKPEKAKEVWAKLREAENFFKHADRDSSDSLEFCPGQTENLIFDACSQYYKLTEELVPIFQVFNIWFMIHHQDLYDLSPNMAALKQVAFPGQISKSRVVFFEKMLPLAASYHA